MRADGRDIEKLAFDLESVREIKQDRQQKSRQHQPDNLISDMLLMSEEIGCDARHRPDGKKS